MSSDGSQVVEDTDPNSHKVAMVPDGFMVQDIQGIRARVTTRLDGRGYDITKLGPYKVRTGQMVYMNDSHLSGDRDSAEHSNDEHTRSPDVHARFFVDFTNPDALPIGADGFATDVSVAAQTALFGGDPTRIGPHSELRAAWAEGIEVVRVPDNVLGCAPFARDYRGADVVLLLRRGQCTFLEKLRHARIAGAAGIVVLSDENLRVQPSAEPAELALAGALDDVVALVLRRAEGERVVHMVEVTETQRLGRVVMVIEPPEVDGDGFGFGLEDTRAGRVLHVNGQPLLNTRLIV